MDFCLRGGKILRLILLLKGIRGRMCNAEVLGAVTAPETSSPYLPEHFLAWVMRESEGLGTSVGLPWYHITALTRVSVSQRAQQRVRVISPGWGFGCSPDGFSSLEARMLDCLRASTTFPLIPPHSRLGWLWSSQPSSFVAPTLTSRRFKD